MKKLSEMTYEELSRFANEVLSELKRKAYAEGYDRGKFDGAVSGEYLGKRVRKTAQEIRDEIVERAEEYVDKTTKKLTELPFYPEFIVNKDNRSVTVILRGRAVGKVIAKGDAKARPDDCFNVHIGKAIALHKALGLDTPAEYLNAPQPTEARIGDVIYRYGISEITSGRRTIVGEKYGKCGRKIYLTKEGYLGGNTYVDDRYKIIDDSREGVDE